jgi:TatD DNase family protein
MLETDCPYCEIRNSHASSQFVETKFQSKKPDRFEEGKMVNGRNEPAKIVQVCEVMARIMNVDKHDLAEAAYANTLRLFNLE